MSLFPTLRPFQISAHESLRQGVRDGHKNQVIMAPTGAGKGLLAIRIAHEAEQRGKRAVLICDRRALVYQLAESAGNYGVSNFGVQMGDDFNFHRPEAAIQICSAQTLQNRKFPQADVVIVDECHTLMPSWVNEMKESKALWVGLSATPFTKGLGTMFSNLINATTMAELVQQKFLVPMRVISCVKPDMAGAATSGGEWTAKAAGERGMEIIGDVVLEWKKHADNGKTIVFGSTIKHCEELVKQFNEAGVMACLYTSNTAEKERRSILKEYKRRDSVIRVLVSVEALAKGFDVPDVTFVVDARPLRKSLSTAIQMWGRGARSSPDTGKEFFTLLDCSGNFLRFQEDFENIYCNGLDRLDDGENLDKKVRKDEEQDKEPKSCPACGYSPFFKTCMSCGHEKRIESAVEHENGVGVEVRGAEFAKAERAEKQKFYSQLLGYQEACGYSHGWTAHKYKEKFGVWPRGLSETPVTPSPEVARWIKHQQIKYAKGKQKRERLTGVAA